MQKSSSLIALLLVAAIVLMPTENSRPNEILTASPLAVSGDAANFDPQAENENDTVKIIVAVIIIILVIYCIADTKQDQSKEVKADWK